MEVFVSFFNDVSELDKGKVVCEGFFCLFLVLNLRYFLCFEFRLSVILVGKEGGIYGLKGVGFSLFLWAFDRILLFCI